MKLINNTSHVLYYYIPHAKIYNLLYFGQQLETMYNIVSFKDSDEWIKYVSDELKNTTWLTDDIKKSIEDMKNSTVKYHDYGYLTPYHFRLNVNDDTDNMLDNAIASNQDPVEIKTGSGDKLSISRDKLIDLTNQYKLDKPLYLSMVEEK